MEYRCLFKAAQEKVYTSNYYQKKKKNPARNSRAWLHFGLACVLGQFFVTGIKWHTLIFCHLLAKMGGKVLVQTESLGRGAGGDSGCVDLPQSWEQETQAGSLYTLPKPAFAAPHDSKASLQFSKWNWFF